MIESTKVKVNDVVGPPNSWQCQSRLHSGLGDAEQNKDQSFSTQNRDILRIRRNYSLQFDQGIKYAKKPSREQLPSVKNSYDAEDDCDEGLLSSIPRGQTYRLSKVGANEVRKRSTYSPTYPKRLPSSTKRRWDDNRPSSCEYNSSSNKSTQPMEMDEKCEFDDSRPKRQFNVGKAQSNLRPNNIIISTCHESVDAGMDIDNHFDETPGDINSENMSHLGPSVGRIDATKSEPDKKEDCSGTDAGVLAEEVARVDGECRKCDELGDKLKAESEKCEKLQRKLDRAKRNKETVVKKRDVFEEQLEAAKAELLAERKRSESLAKAGEEAREEKLRMEKDLADHKNMLGVINNVTRFFNERTDELKLNEAKLKEADRKAKEMEDELARKQEWIDEAKIKLSLQMGIQAEHEQQMARIRALFAVPDDHESFEQMFSALEAIESEYLSMRTEQYASLNIG